MTYGILFQCVYSAWMLGGIYPSMQWPVAVVSVVLCLLVFALPVLPRKALYARVLKDPLFYCGTILLLILFLQLINSGYDAADTGRFRFRFFPWSFSFTATAGMLNGFFPVFTALLAVRHVLHRSDVKVLVLLLVWNSALLASAGIFFELLDGNKLLGIWERTRSDSFASFDYPNHAAAWFYLHAALAVGLAHDAEVKHKPRIRVAVLGTCFMCCIAASCLTLSRMGAFVAMIQLGVVFVILLARTRRNFKSTAAVNRYIGVGILALAGITLFFGAGNGRLVREVGSKKLVGEQSLAGDLSGRGPQVEYAWRVTRDFPVFGAGPWGCHVLAGHYLPGEELESWKVNGRINVHCDPAQFLAEFGFAGGLCMLLAVAVLVHDAARAKRGVLFYWISGGIVVLALHSLIDLPFRCPAILLAWAVLLAGIPVLSPRSSAGRGPE